MARKYPRGRAGHFHAAEQLADFLPLRHRIFLLPRTPKQVASSEFIAGRRRRRPDWQPRIRTQRQRGLGIRQRHYFGRDAGAVDGVRAQDPSNRTGPVVSRYDDSELRRRGFADYPRPCFRRRRALSDHSARHRMGTGLRCSDAVFRMGADCLFDSDAVALADRPAAAFRTCRRTANRLFPTPQTD